MLLYVDVHMCVCLYTYFHLCVCAPALKEIYINANVYDIKGDNILIPQFLRVTLMFPGTIMVMINRKLDTLDH